jgi:release factor glutamine methyltransferase
MDAHRSEHTALPTWGDAREWAIARLRAGADPTTAPLDADVLLAFALGVAKEELLAHPERGLAPDDAARFRALVERRYTGEPVAYLRGFKEFYGLRFRVDPRVLIPRPETETLVDAARRFIAGRALRVVDVGTGSGAVACAIAASEPRVRVIATDLSDDALIVARENAASLGVDGQVEFRRGDLLSPVTEQVDVVCANLPYLRDDALEHLVGARTSLAFEPRAAVVAGADGLDLVRRCVSDLPRVLAPGGAAFFECDPPQAAAIAALIEAQGMRTDVLRDLTDAQRIVVASS